MSLSIDRNHYKHIKDLDTVRPRYSPTPKAPKGCGRAFGLYLQDQASHVMCDKYGLEKGHAMWENSIGGGPRGGAMFAMSQTENSFSVDDLSLAIVSYPHNLHPLPTICFLGVCSKSPCIGQVIIRCFSEAP